MPPSSRAPHSPTNPPNFNRATCAIWGAGVTQLAAQIRENFLVFVDKRALGMDSGHVIVVQWIDDSDSREFRGGLNGSRVDATVNVDGSTTYTFTGGAAGIRDESGAPADNVTVRCPNLDTIAITVLK